MISEVFMVCDAYESGVGKGLRASKHANPWKEGTEEQEAYKIGYEFGMRKYYETKPDGQ